MLCPKCNTENPVKTLAVVVIVAFLGIGVILGTYVLTKSKQPKSTPELFKDNDLGLALKYPEELRIEKENTDVVFYADRFKEKWEDGNLYSPCLIIKRDEFTGWIKPGGKMMPLDLLQFKEFLISAQEECQASTDFCIIPGPPRFHNFTTIGGEKAIEAGQTLPGPLNDKIISFYVQHSDNKYEINLHLPSNEKKRNQLEKIFREMILSINFINQ